MSYQFLSFRPIWELNLHENLAEWSITYALCAVIRTHRCAVASLFLLVLDYLLDAVQKLDAEAVDISAWKASPTFLSAYNFYQKRPSKKSEVTMLKSASGNLITWMQQMMSIRECKKILIKEAIIYILDFIPSK